MLVSLITGILSCVWVTTAVFTFIYFFYSSAPITTGTTPAFGSHIFLFFELLVLLLLDVAITGTYTDILFVIWEKQRINQLINWWKMTGFKWLSHAVTHFQLFFFDKTEHVEAFLDILLFFSSFLLTGNHACLCVAAIYWILTYILASTIPIPLI